MAECRALPPTPASPVGQKWCPLDNQRVSVWQEWDSRPWSSHNPCGLMPMPWVGSTPSLPSLHPQLYAQDKGCSGASWVESVSFSRLTPWGPSPTWPCSAARTPEPGPEGQGDLGLPGRRTKVTASRGGAGAACKTSRLCTPSPSLLPPPPKCPANSSSPSRDSPSRRLGSRLPSPGAQKIDQPNAPRGCKLRLWW